MEKPIDPQVLALLSAVWEVAKPLLVAFVAVKVHQMRESQKEQRHANRRRDAERAELLQKVREIHAARTYARATDNAVPVVQHDVKT